MLWHLRETHAEGGLEAHDFWGIFREMLVKQKHLIIILLLFHDGAPNDLDLHEHLEVEVEKLFCHSCWLQDVTRKAQQFTLRNIGSDLTNKEVYASLTFISIKIYKNIITSNELIDKYRSDLRVKR